MKPRKTRDIENNLKRKGFRAINRNHIFYVLYVNGKKTSIRTKISHGSKEYPGSLLIQMAKQLHLKRDEFNNLIDCPLTQEELIEILIKRGVLITT